MTRFSPNSILALALVAATPALGDVLSCADVNCPVAGGTAINDCKVVNRTLVNIGAVTLPAAEGFPSGGLTWVEGFRAIETRPNRTYERTFYLGTLSGSNFSTPACAVFLEGFKAVDQPQASEGSCGTSMSKECSDALLKRVTAIKAGNSTEDTCQKLQADLEENLDDACKGHVPTNDKQWSNVTVKALSGPTAVKPISSSENSTSNCWPVPNKSSDLTLVETESTLGDLYAGTILDIVHDITPILTVVYPESGDAQAQIACLEIKDESTRGRENMNNGSGDDDRSAAASLAPVSVLAMATIAIGAFLAL